jgi:hypothetical protein
MLSFSQSKRNADPREAFGVEAWAREVKTCSNNLPYLFSSPAVVMYLKLVDIGSQALRQAGRQA